MSTYDIAYSRHDGNLLFVANIYQLQADDFIFSDRSTGTINFYNAKGFTRHGAELDFQYNVSKDLLISANASYLHGDEISQVDTTKVFTPKLSVNLGIKYFYNQHSIGASLRQIGQRSAAESLSIVNLNYQYQLDQLSFFVTMENMLDENILHPNMAEFSARLVPGGQNRNVKLGFRYAY